MSDQLLPLPLEVKENPGLETFDPRLDEIITLVQDGLYERAAQQSANILEEGNYDIRIVGYFLYGHFLEQGVGGLGKLFDWLAGMLGENFDAIGPIRNREKQTQTVLNWLLKQLDKKFRYEESKESGVYQGWIEDVSSEQVENALDAIDRLRRVLGPLLEDAAGPVLDSLTKVAEWLAAFQSLVFRSAEEFEESEENPELNETWEEQDSADEFRHLETGEDRAKIVFSEEGRQLDDSYPMQELKRKLKAFSLLITSGNHSGAAIVANDINTIIANFDPRLYFPQLFADFTKQYLQNIKELVVFDGYKGGVEWQAMQDLYNVDLEGFVNFHSSGMSLPPPAGEEEYVDQEEGTAYEGEPDQIENADDGW